MRLDVLEENINAPEEYAAIESSLIKEREELRKAESDPGYIDIKLQIDECDKLIKVKEKEHNNSIGKISEIKLIIKNSEQEIDSLNVSIKIQDEKLNTLIDNDAIAAKEGMQKYEEQISKKAMRGL